MSDNYKEATITINGKELSFQESMTLRVAISSFISNLHANGLGTDEHGLLMTKSYLKHAREIENQIINSK